LWIKCNPNPLGKQTSDCVVRAIAIATEQSWKRTYRELCELGEIEAEMPNANSVWGLYLRNKGGKQFLLPESCPACVTVRAFCEKYPTGVYVIGTGSHAVCVMDGDYYDAWDSGNEVPSYFWRVQ
jgi:hypothetical protein